VTRVSHTERGVRIRILNARMVTRAESGIRLKKGSNVVVLDPRVARAFPTSEAVNAALLSLLDLAQKSARGRRAGR